MLVMQHLPDWPYNRRYHVDQPLPHPPSKPTMPLLPSQAFNYRHGMERLPPSVTYTSYAASAIAAATNSMVSSESEPAAYADYTTAVMSAAQDGSAGV